MGLAALGELQPRSALVLLSTSGARALGWSLAVARAVDSAIRGGGTAPRTRVEESTRGAQLLRVDASFAVKRVRRRRVIGRAAGARREGGVWGERSEWHGR